MISDKKKFVFIHPPKVGGNTIHTVLKDYYSINVRAINNRAGIGQGLVVYRKHEQDTDKHSKLTKIYKMFPQARDYYKFSIMRNPWDRVASWFSWWNTAIPAEDTCRDFKVFVQRLAQAFDDRLAFNEGGGVVPSFMRASAGDWEIEDALQPLASWWKGDSGQLAVDFLIKFENYENGLREVCKKLDISIEKIPRINASGNKNYRDFYRNENGFDEEAIEKVRRVFKEDLKIINYKFN